MIAELAVSADMQHFSLDTELIQYYTTSQLRPAINIMADERHLSHASIQQSLYGVKTPAMTSDD